MKPSSPARGLTLVPEDPTTSLRRWTNDRYESSSDVTFPKEARGSRAGEGPSIRAGETWSMVWCVDAEGSTVMAGLRDPAGREWRYERFASPTRLTVDLSDFRFVDQAE